MTLNNVIMRVLTAYDALKQVLIDSPHLLKWLNRAIFLCFGLKLGLFFLLFDDFHHLFIRFRQQMRVGFQCLGDGRMA